MKQSAVINALTELYCILGHPVAHSLSPKMHNAAFKFLGNNAVYLAFDVTDVQGALNAIVTLNIKGVSVTVPHKEAIMPFLDFIDPFAAKIGAVNTIFNRNGRLEGYNTDCLGAVHALEAVTNLEGKTCVVLGAGGSAKAVAVGLQQKGAHVHIANRTLEKAKELSEQVAGSYSSLEAFNVKADVLINTTTVGMKPNEHISPINNDLLSGVEVVMDIVYAPLMTKLLKDASEQGCRIVNGLSMLVHQAVAQQEIWNQTKLSELFDVMSSAILTKE